MEKSSSLMRKRIKNYVLKFYVNAILNNKTVDKKNSSNIMITSYFKYNMYNIQCANNDERKKFFFAFRNKYRDEFKYFRKYYTTLISNFRNRTAYKKFKSNFTAQEWDRIDGDRLSKYLALRNDSIKKTDFEYLLDIIKIIDNK